MAARSTARTALYTLTGGALALYGLRWATTRRAQPAVRGEIEVSRSQIIQAPRDEVYRRFSAYEDLPKILKHIEKVEILDGNRQRWTADLFAKAAKVEWIAEVVDELPGRRIAWRAIAGAPVDMSGEVLFEDADDDATLLHVELRYKVPGKLLGRVLKPALEEEIRADVRRFQALLESGEVPTTLGQPAGAGRRHGIALIDKIGGKT